jgi:hypothetical protein
MPSSGAPYLQGVPRTSKACPVPSRRWHSAVVAASAVLGQNAIWVSQTSYNDSGETQFPRAGDGSCITAQAGKGISALVGHRGGRLMLTFAHFDTVLDEA